MPQDQCVRIIGVPLDLGAGHRGVDMGPSAIRITNLHSRLARLGWEVIDDGDLQAEVFESISIGDDARVRHARAVLAVVEALAARVEAIFDDGQFPLVIGGDHSLAIGSVAGAAAHFKKRNEKIGLIWIDAHADMNTPETTPSGNIHGMSMAVSIGLGDERFTKLAGYAGKVDPKHIALIAARELDPGEREALLKRGMCVATMRDIDEKGMPAVMREAIRVATDGTAGIYLSFDMDALDPEFAPGTGTPVPGGLTYREAHLAMEWLHDSRKVLGADMVETNPALDVRNQTARVATEMILSLLGKRILGRSRS